MHSMAQADKSPLASCSPLPLQAEPDAHNVAAEHKPAFSSPLQAEPGGRLQPSSGRVSQSPVPAGRVCCTTKATHGLSSPLLAVRVSPLSLQAEFPFLLQAESDALRSQLTAQAAESSQRQVQLEKQANEATVALAEERQRVKQLEGRVRELEGASSEQPQGHKQQQQLSSGTEIGGNSSSSGLGSAVPSLSQEERMAGAAATASGAGGAPQGGYDGSGSRSAPPPADVGATEGGRGGKAGGGGEGGSSAMAAEMLAMMEGQLGRLSEMIRQRDTEVRDPEMGVTLEKAGEHRGTVRDDPAAGCRGARE